MWSRPSFATARTVPEILGQLRRGSAPRRPGDDGIVLWTLTPVEVISALRRLVREGALPEETATVAEQRVAELSHASHVVVDVAPVKALAVRLLRIHSLRAFDALQLAAALHWVEGHPQGRTFHTLDRRLAQAARREGFVVPI